MSKLYSWLSKHVHINTTYWSQNSTVLGKGISSEDAAWYLADSVFKSINQKLHVGGIFYDLAKAFDCVNDEILLATLHLYRIWGVSEDRFRFCLTNRRLTQFNSKCFLWLGYTKTWSSPRINSLSEPILFPDYMTVIISSRNFEAFCSVSM